MGHTLTICTNIASRVGYLHNFGFGLGRVPHQLASCFPTLRQSSSSHWRDISQQNNGGKYVSNELQNLYNVHGIRHEFNVPYNPQQNRVAKRKNRTLLDANRTLLTIKLNLI